MKRRDGGRRVSFSLLVPAPAAALLAALAACGGPADPRELADAGYEQLARSRYAAAVEEFEAALAASAPDDAGWMRIKSGHLTALAHVDPERAAAEFLQLAGERELELGEYGLLANSLIAESHVKPAREVLIAAWQRFPEAEPLERLVFKALVAGQDADDPGAALQGLGYTAGADGGGIPTDPRFREDLRAFLRLPEEQRP